MRHWRSANLEHFADQAIALKGLHAVDEVAGSQRAVARPVGLSLAAILDLFVHEHEVLVVQWRMSTSMELLNTVPELPFILNAGTTLPLERLPIQSPATAQNVVFELDESVSAVVLDEQIEAPPLGLQSRFWQSGFERSHKERPVGRFICVAQIDHLGMAEHLLERGRRGGQNPNFHRSSVARKVA